MFFGKSYWKSQEQGIQKEWLLTNGIGGFSCGTIIGMNARRYHGLLIASLKPPVDRFLILSGISESVHLYGNSLIEKETKSVRRKTVSGKRVGSGTVKKSSLSADKATLSGAVAAGTAADIQKQEEAFEEYYLHSFRTPDFQGHGEHWLESFHYEFIPEFQYRIGLMTITKRICLRYGMNQAVIVYHVGNHSRKRAVMRFTPLINYRNYHYLSSHRYMTFSAVLNNGLMEITPYDKDRRIRVGCSEGNGILLPSCYFYNMDYPYEHERGLDGTEDHFIPGYFETELSPGEQKTITIVCSLQDEIDTLDGEALIDQEISRQKLLLSSSGSASGRKGSSTGKSAGKAKRDDMPASHLKTTAANHPSAMKGLPLLNQNDWFLKQLLLAADKFIVYRKSTDSKTVIAGYPWFTDWGRDTMIALIGLTLAGNRFEDAREIIYTFARYEKNGLIPNVFPDGDEEPAYNTVDAALWFFEAVWQYLQYTGDLQFIQEQLLPVLERIIAGYRNGTDFEIKMDQDFLISAGNEDTQLTWMDAKVGSWVVTPRHGKAVEINALWYNALMIMAQLMEKTGGDGTPYKDMASEVKKSFVSVFWNENHNCLYDIVNAEGPDAKIRPNQILAVSLSYPVLDGEQATKVVDVVHELLYTALGLRTLNRQDPEYRGIYIGDQYARDGAYHQGTVWTWPLGRFITAYARVYSKQPDLKKQLEIFFSPFMDHLRDACIGNISEIFDGDEPLIPRGCFAQAWSVSEILRSYVEDYLPLIAAE